MTVSARLIFDIRQARAGSLRYGFRILRDARGRMVGSEMVFIEGADSFDPQNCHVKTYIIPRLKR